MKKLFTSFVLAFVSYSMVVAQCGTPIDTITENFDGSANLPNCWTINATNGNGAVYVLNNSGYSVSGTNSLRMGHTGGSGTSVLYAVLPIVTNASGDLSFYARTDGSSPIQIGTMSSPNNTGSFTLIQTVAPTSAYQLFTVNMAAYTGTNQYIAFRYNMPSGRWMVLDNVTYTAALTGGDPCATPSVLIDNMEYYPDFDSDLGCWTTYASNPNGSIYILNNANYAASGVKSLRMGPSGGAGPATLFVVTPKVAGLNGMLTFQARTDGNTPLLVGTMPNATDTAGFEVFDTIYHNSIYQEYTVDFTSYLGLDSFIVFKYEMPGSIWTLLDDVNYTAAITPNSCNTAIDEVIEDFDIYTSSAMPECWYEYSSNANGTTNVFINAGYAASGTNSLRMGYISFNQPPATLYAVMPKMNNISEKRMTLQSMLPNAGFDYFQVGTMPTATDTASFVAFKTITNASSNFYKLDTVDFTTYTGTDSFIVFKYIANLLVVVDDINFSIGTAISTIVEHQTLNIYPNPAATNITLDTKETIESVSIYNLSGQLVKFVGQSENIIDIQDLPKGLYIVQAQTEKGIYQNKLTKS